MDEHRKMRDTLIEVAVVGASATALAALIAAAVALLIREFADTRVYLVALGLVSALLAYALGMLLSRQGGPGARSQMTIEDRSLLPGLSKH